MPHTSTRGDDAQRFAASTTMSNYPTSTQKSFWLYDTHEDMRAAREETRATTLKSATLNDDGESTSAKTVEKDALTSEEERLILRYHEHKIQTICAAFVLPRKVKITAVMLFKRFTLRHGVGAHSLKIIMLTSIYVACKVEESYISADEFCKGVREDPARVLAAEVTFLSGLKFQLVCYGAARPLDGFLRDVEDGGCKVTGAQLVACRKSALETIDALMLTDVPLVRPPGQIALCALRRAARQAEATDLVEYCEAVGARATGIVKAPKGALLKGILDEIETHVEDGTEPDEAVVKKIDKKLKLWRAKYVAASKATAEDEAKKTERDAKRRKSEQSRQEMIAAEEDALG